MSGPLRVALVGGPMYDGLYPLLGDDIEVVVHADHPTLNREVAALLAAGERLDLISTHGKYAPSQARWLQPLDDLVPAEVLAELAPRAVDLCRFEGSLYCVPRNIDVRVLWWRTDLLESAPLTWADVEAASGSFGFTGRESGLFGLFYELMASQGASIFGPDAEPTLDGPDAIAAVERLQRLAAKGPADLPGWHYDEVDAALLDGRVAMAAAWPGGYGAIRASDRYSVLAPTAYPGGRSYSGVHGWAIPTTCGDLDGATELLLRMASAEAGALEAASGGVPAHLGAMVATVPIDDIDAQRLAITRSTIEQAMLTYPPLERFPEVEDAAWGALHDALTGARSAADAIAAMQRSAEAVLGG